MNKLICRLLQQVSLYRFCCSSSPPVNSSRREKFTVASPTNPGKGCCIEIREQEHDTKMCFGSAVLMPLSSYNRWLLPELEIALYFRTYLATAAPVQTSKWWSCVPEGGLGCACLCLSSHLSFERKLNSLYFLSSLWRHSWAFSLGITLFLINLTLN